MRRGLLIVLSLAAAACGSGGEATGQCPDDGCTVAVTSDVPYVERDTVTAGKPLFDVYAPDEGGPWPVVLIGPAHGQEKGFYRDWATAMATGGAVVFAVDFEVGAPLTPLAHLNCAARYVRDVAPDYGGDPSHVTLVGSDNGAVFGAPVTLGVEELPSACLASDDAAIPDAFVGYAGYYGVSGQAPGGLVAAGWIDPTTLIGQNPDLVVRLLHGDAPDADTPMSWSEEFARMLADAGYDVEFTIVEGGTRTGIESPSSPAFDAIVDTTLDVARG